VEIHCEALKHLGQENIEGMRIRKAKGADVKSQQATCIQSMI
jgi:hypothetical protein